MKNIWKIMAALLVVALPFVATACGDDEEDVIPTYTYTWELKGIDLNKIPQDDQIAVINARNEVNKLIAKAYTNAKFTVSSSDSKFSIQTDRSVKDLDETVQITFLTLKQTEEFKTQAAVLPSNSTLLIKRGSTTVVNNVALYNN